MAKKKENYGTHEEIDLMRIIDDSGGYKITPVSDEEIKESKSSPLFEVINAIFTSKSFINNMTRQQADQNLFMVLRRLAINYPIQANVFNHGKVNSLDVMKFWSDYLYCGKVPRWAYTSTRSKKNEYKKKEDITENDISEYIEFYCIERKSFDFAMKIFHEESISDVLEFKKYMKTIKGSNEKDNFDND